MAAELAPLFAEVPADIDLFDFTISSGLQPRLWIDAVSHVAMARDRRTYRFVKDTRAGRVVLAEDTAIKPVADHVARYVAERLIERERLMEGGAEPALLACERRAPRMRRRWCSVAAGRPSCRGSVLWRPARWLALSPRRWRCGTG